MMTSGNDRLHLIGTLHSGPLFLRLHVEDGGVWEIDPTAAALPLVGRRVEVIGTRVGFNDLQCDQIWPAGSPMPPERPHLLVRMGYWLWALAALLTIGALFGRAP